MDKSLRHALKEWAIATEALAQGQTLMLLRKGGIREQEGRFRVAQTQVLLYPTLEHQKPELLKPEYTSAVAPIPSGWHPEAISIQAWAEITDIFAATDPETVSALYPYHIWNERFISDRLNWKARSPLYILLLRVYNLAQAQTFPYRADYGGCRSWIEIESAISIAQSQPALSDTEYAQQTRAIRQILQTQPSQDA
ncbi:DUF1802 family protein [Geitlerinema splendidum]|nr:DUF1802 family protein [Geitlerinema splendidum]